MNDEPGPEIAPNLSDEMADMPNEGAVNANTELRKRRSTRIVQAVPLVVTGVDALGRPFAERTSTLIINCHGCRYQSKHYVLKNMWVNLEVPAQSQATRHAACAARLPGFSVLARFVNSSKSHWNWKFLEMSGASPFRRTIGLRSRKISHSFPTQPQLALKLRPACPCQPQPANCLCP